MSHGATARLDDPAMRLASDQSMQKMEPNAKINNDVGQTSGMESVSELSKLESKGPLTDV